MPTLGIPSRRRPAQVLDEPIPTWGSREAGKSFEHTLEALLDARSVRYTAQAETDNHDKLDFLFPSEEAYHDLDFLFEGLAPLGAKTTYKDRWRQVLSEGERMPDKRLATLKGEISLRQTNDMRQRGLQLIVPTPLRDTYRDIHREWLWSVSRFFERVESC